MVNLAEMIENATDGEAIEAAVIGPFDGRSGEAQDAPFVGRVLSWEEARRHLDYEYDNGFGGADCHPVLAWTASWVVGIAEYDGSTGCSRVPRNPVACRPGYMDAN